MSCTSLDLATDIAQRQVLRYASYCYDAESGMYYLSARHYDPVTRQFLSKDLSRNDGEQSAYQYCGGNPVLNIDPTGFWEWPEWCKKIGRGAKTLFNGLKEAVVGLFTQVGEGAYAIGKEAARAGKWVADTAESAARAFFGDETFESAVSAYDEVKKGLAPHVPGVSQATWMEAWLAGKYAETGDPYCGIGSMIFSAWSEDQWLDTVAIGGIGGAIGRSVRTSAPTAGARQFSIPGIEYAYHYTFDRYVPSIMREGLAPRQYATPHGQLSFLQAQIDLALKPNRGLTNTVIQVDLNGLRQAGYEIPGISLVARDFNMPGGGFEMQFPYAVPPQFLEVVGR